MSYQAQGFVRDSRFGAGQVIKGTNRATVRKWMALSPVEIARELVKPGICECGKGCCLCSQCTALFKGRCADCAKVPGVKRAE